MGIQLHIVDAPDGEPYMGDLADDPGAMWRWPEFDREGREAWIIVLPNRAGLWWTTWVSQERMWDVAGTPPNITVNPSINAGENDTPHGWHGWIKNGVMTP